MTGKGVEDTYGVIKSHKTKKRATLVNIIKTNN